MLKKPGWMDASTILFQELSFTRADAQITPGYLWVPWRLEGCDYHLCLSEKKNLRCSGKHNFVQAGRICPGFLGGLLKKPIDIRILSLKGISGLLLKKHQLQEKSDEHCGNC